MEKTEQFDPKSLSKPINAIEEKTSWWDNWLNKKSKITFTPEKEDKEPIKSPDQATETADKDKNLKTFFGDKEEKNWPPVPGERLMADNKTSIHWIIAGSLTVIVLVVVILASFGLINMLRNGISQHSLTGIEQQIQQASTLFDKGELTEAKSTLEKILTDDVSNQKAEELLRDVNRKIGDSLIASVLKYNEININEWPHETYVSDDQMFAVGQSKDWEKIDSDFDVKFDIGQSTLGVRQIPEVKSLSEAQNIYLSRIASDGYTLINQREDVAYNGTNARIMVAENQSYYLVSLIFQKYYLAYEISGALDKNTYQNDMTALQQFLISFQLLNNYDLGTYDNLAAFTKDNLIFYGWPEKLSVEDKDYIIQGFADSYAQITDLLDFSLQENITVYLYPDWPTLYQYTLAKNSFIKGDNREIHLVYISQAEHQSFGYELTKLIVQNMVKKSVEPLVIEGLATTLDQTGRDYVVLVRESRYIPLEQLIGVNWELNQDGDVKYFIAGTFAQYLIDRYGIDAYINLIKSDQFPIAYEDNYGLTLSELEEAYKTANGF